MKSRMAQSGMILVLLLTLLLIALATIGCKKKSEPAPVTETEKAVSTAIEQTTCPVMGGAINKDIFTEYKGKKVYFCCPGCKEQFDKEPEKYLEKLPQFSD
ncbi:MAG: YHS domain-containing protein [Planctomycetota bacterium]